MRATFVTSSPQIDGALGDAVWAHCNWQNEFTQREPLEGAPAMSVTRVCILYDGRALYVAARMDDPQPDKLIKVLGRRDALGNADKIIVAVDSYHDHLTGFRFEVTPSANIADGAMHDDTGIDYSWDGVWRVRTAIDAHGWQAELEIPFATLRFQPRDALTFGVQFQRYVSRSAEVSAWSPLPRATNADASQFGHLTELQQARPGLDLQVLPYGLVRSTLSRAANSTIPDETAHFEAGLDLKASLTGTLTLDASVNPDFGQVEVDPAVVNLTAFEVLLPEKRPFFLEGAEIFQTPLTLLYTRRIGAQPGDPDIADDEIVVETDLARILAAGKVSGRAGKTAIGLLAAGVNDTDALIRGDDGSLREVETGTDTFFGAARVRQPIGARSTLGGMVTFVGRDNEADALAGGPDIEVRDGEWVYTGYFVASDAENDQGYGTGVSADLTSRVWGAYFSAVALSPSLDLNDAGFVQEVNRIRGFALGRWRLAEPHGILRESWERLIATQAVDYDGRNVERTVSAELEQTFRNLWLLFVRPEYRFANYDNYETRGGPTYQRPGRGGAQVQLTTNKNLDLSAILGSTVFHGDGDSLDTFLELNLRAFGRLELWPRLAYALRRGQRRWIDTVEDVAGSHYIFGDLDFDQIEATLRATLGLSRTWTLQAFAQFLHARGTHANVRELVGAEPNVFASFAYAGEPNFQSTSAVFNAVLRWEYLPLSSVYLVWTHRSTFGFDTTGEPPFEPGDALASISDLRGDDVVLLKISYLWQL